MLDEAAIFLRNAGKKSRHIDKSHDWNIETIADERAALREAWSQVASELMG